MEEYRIKGKKALEIVLNNSQNINIFEKNIYEITEKNLNDEKLEDKYLLNIYQIINDIKKGNKLKDLLNSLKNSKINWKHDFYNEIENEEVEQNNFIENPFEIEEGVLECNKCGSKRVFSYQKQSRSADEPMSTYATCVACKSKWIYSG
jgi:transcription elongation factor S-II